MDTVASAWSRAHPGGGSGGNSVCAHWCADNFPEPGNVCTAPAAHEQGPCYVCGPLKKSPTEQLCSGVCRETSTDVENCGQCGKMVSSKFLLHLLQYSRLELTDPRLQCLSGAICDTSSCKCSNSGLPPCDGACPDLQTDSKNCGKCESKVSGPLTERKSTILTQ